MEASFPTLNPTLAFYCLIYMGCEAFVTGFIQKGSTMQKFQKLLVYSKIYIIMPYVHADKQLRAPVVEVIATAKGT